MLFTQSKIKKAEIKVDTKALRPLCHKCGLYKTAKHPHMKVGGKGRKNILIIGEAPGRTEDFYGDQFIGDAGEFLEDSLAEIGIDLHKDCFKINAVNCIPLKPSGNGIRTPKAREISACHPYVEKVIREIKPKVILLFGNVALNSFVGSLFDKKEINKWRNFIIPDRRYNTFVIPLFHPSFLIRNERDKNLHLTFKRDLKKVKKFLQNIPEVETTDYEQYVTPLKDFSQVVQFLKDILRRKPTIAFDYETSGLKPFKNGHKIATIGIATSDSRAVAFPFKYRNFWTEKEFKEIESLWKQILADKQIKKIAHNANFEMLWSRGILGTYPKSLFWDTMIAAKIIDNRKGVVGLKFLTYVKYGVPPYDEHISKFLRPDSSGFNSVDKAPLNDLLLYNGLDCIFTFKLHEEQKPIIANTGRFLNAFNFFMAGVRAMNDLQMNGVIVDSDYYSKADVYLGKKIKKLEHELLTSEEAKKFKKKYGQEILITSNADIGNLLFKVLGYKGVKTDKGNYKVDKVVLEKIDSPWIKKLLELRKFEKAKGTYLAQFKREIHKGKIHSFFNLHIPVSYRSSSSSPNWQNIPKRQEDIKKIIRKGVKAPKDFYLCEGDFSGAEVVTSAAYHKDPNFINYLIDPESDMHRDLASDIFLLPDGMLNNPDYSKEEKKKAKLIRFYAKNNWTFAQFYGDYFGSCGPNLWENVVESGLELPNGKTVKEHLEEIGIYGLGEITPDGPTPGSFLEHLKEVEHKMWHERFPKYTEWKEEIVEFYRKHGYIETYLGFRFQGYMTVNQCRNYPIQGTSFHLLLDTLIRFNYWLKKNKFKTYIFGQIHDSILFYLHKDEKDYVIPKLNKIVTSLHKRFPWMVVPMELELEMSKLGQDGGNWAELEEVKIN